MAALTPPETPPPLRVPRVLLLIGGAVILVAVLVSLPALPLLAGLLFPPLPPLPPDVVEREHVSEVYGVDRWTYAIDQPACTIAAAYAEHGQCVTSAAFTCDGLIRDPGLTTADIRCAGTLPFAAFIMRWEAEVQGSDLIVTRVVDWTPDTAADAVPPTAPSP